MIISRIFVKSLRSGSEPPSLVLSSAALLLRVLGFFVLTMRVEEPFLYLRHSCTTRAATFNPNSFLGSLNRMPSSMELK